MKLKVKFKYVVDNSLQDNNIGTLEKIAKVIQEMAKLDELPKWSVEIVDKKKEKDE